MLGVRAVDFTAFDRSKLDEYAERAKKEWGDTPQFKEFEEIDSSRTSEDKAQLTERFMTLFAEFGELKEGSPDSPEAQAQVRKLQSFITENMYTCTDDILCGLGKMYAAGGEFTENIDKAGGKGTAEYTAAAIRVCLG